MIELTDEQRREGAKILQRVEAHEPVSILVGPAGTGKTTLLRSLIADVRKMRRQTVACTPTGKAALRLWQVTEHPALTIHRAIYGQADDNTSDPDPRKRGKLVFGDPHAPCEPGGVVFVDEGSMVGTELWGDLTRMLPHKAAIVVVADHEQLMPVNDDWGPDLLHPHAQLTEIHRQAAGNPIISYATAVRHNRGGDWRRAYHAADDRLLFHDGVRRSSISRWAVQQYGAGEDITVLTWTHRVRESLNAEIRAGLGLTGRIVPGDRLVIRMNAYAVGLLNGEVHEVEAVEPCEVAGLTAWDVRLRGMPETVRVLDQHLNDRSQDVWTTRRAVGQEAWDEQRIVHAWHGFALTIHSAQGSQWRRVGLVVDRAVRRLAKESPDEGRRMVYTGVTRASESLDVFRMDG